ncbi:MAG: cytochrome c oxidase subunit 3 [Flavobacteriales bacterium]|jgi:cytochrome c oxidase subunit 3
MDITLEEKKEIKRKTAKPLLWISMVSMVMIFAGLTSGYVVRRADGEWMTFELPSIFYISTLLIILSSITMLWTAMEAKKEDNNVTLGLGISLALGLAFGVSQFYAWNELTDLGIFFTGDGVSASGSFIYAITGMHLAHVVGGIIALTVSLINSIRGEYSPENKLGLELTAIFWHFLDLLWVYLFLFLLFIR